jgi:CRISPR/Cas system-associated endonuclease Cas3-HD
MNPKYQTYENKTYEDWIRKKRCVICKAANVDCHHVWHARRNSFLSLPLCRECHRFYHDKEWEGFEKKFNVDLSWEIIKSLSEYINETKR